MSQVDQEEVDDDWRHEVSLPDGSVVDVATTEGANAFLNGVSDFRFLSYTVNKIRELTNIGHLNPIQEEELDKHYYFIEDLATNADIKTFRDKVPQSEIEAWLNYLTEEIKGFTDKKTYVSSLLGSCEAMFFQEVPVQLAINGDFFPLLANLVKAHSGNERSLPDKELCLYTFRIVCYAVLTFIRSGGGSIVEVFEKLEQGSDILVQLLRCSTLIDEEEDRDWELFSELFQEIESRPDLLREKFKVGEPCGDTLQAILDDDSNSCDAGVRYIFCGIQELAEEIDMANCKKRAEKYGIICSNCYHIGNAKKRLGFCSQCGIEDYCSEACQKQHWKHHKRDCHKLTDSEKDITLSMRMVVLSFMNEHFETVLESIDNFCARTGLEAREVVVEVNFGINEKCIIPAFKDEDFFKILPIRDYLSGEVVPEWGTLEGFKVFVDKDLVAHAKESASGVLLVGYACKSWSNPNILEVYRRRGKPILRKLLGP